MIDLNNIISKFVVWGIILWLSMVSIILLQGCETLQREPKATDKTKKQNDNADISTEMIAENLRNPWSIAFLPDESAIFTERDGRLRKLKKDLTLDKKRINITVNAESEGGLLGVTVHPDYRKNNLIYLYMTYREEGQVLNKIESYKLNFAEFSLSDRKIILDKIPGNSNHNGGRIKFGPDKKLYITTGDAQQPELAQERDSLAGKILRVNDDGTIPKDNPFNNSPVYSYGHRNPQGIAWHPQTNDMYATEHGKSANDEVNKIEPGKNYGWPEVIGSSDDPKFVNPVLSSGNETWAPSGADFFRTGKNFSNNLFFTALRGQHLHRIIFKNNLEAEKEDKLFVDEFGRLRDVVFGPDNSLYMLTSNQDGRGSPAPGGDRIIRISFNEN